MENLTIEEAIKHAKEVADMNYNDAEKFDSNDSVENYMKDNCMKCAEQHEKLAEWLEELKSYKDIGTLKELKELKENGAFTGLELAKLAIMQKELKKYKDLEEQGLLAILPCKVGTEVYYILGIPNKTPCAIDKCVFKLSDIDKIGESLFLTHKEAEKKLEEMKNGR